MVLIKKNYIKDDKVSYFYQPEEDGEFGEVILYTKDKSFDIVKRAERDSEGNHFYMSHVYCMIRKFIEENNYPDEKTSYWY
ncbi:hypothetical protein ACRVX5_18985 [Clostridioides difficile]|nr:hypothetical protein [Clostridioides difficile]MCM4088755.1 hypothetical protein [Clostridioides difficile]MCM4101949.1 hypothetical protein [Clostridioides difficile]MDI6157760.1 hypothetical protein [Clostridioides difficile]MDO0130442.1 hypothetical protein [Clostridioides difficile]